MRLAKRVRLTADAAKELEKLFACGMATPPANGFNRGGFDADRLPKCQNRAQA